MKNHIIDNRYNNNLSNPHAPGTGCHSWIMSTANHGVMKGLDGETIFEDIRCSIPQGNRRISDKEIQDAINKAMADHNNGTYTPRPRPEPIIKDEKAARQKIIDQGRYSTAEELIKTSPVAIPAEPQRHTKLFIESLYQYDEFLFIGERQQPGIIGETIKDAVDWLTYFIEGEKTAPHIIINPLSGLLAPKKSDEGETYRGDRNIKSYRYCLVEFDNLSSEDQIRFWSGAKLPIIALIDTGGKSIHAWLQVSKMAQVETLEQWDTEIKGRLYDRILTPLGVDSACSNPARLSRLPGHFRKEKGAWQRLLWLSPEGVSL